MLLALGLAIVTYLSSHVRIGIHPDVGRYLREYDLEYREHLLRVVDAYRTMALENEIVIDRNARRFKFSLVCLLDGVVYLSTAVALSVQEAATVTALLGFMGATVAVGVLSIAISRDRFMTLSAHSDNHD